MKQPLFTGTCTALVTPFLNGKVNYPMLEQLIRRQIASGISAVAVCGTTGEAATLTDSEKIAIIHRAKEFAGDDCIIIAGTGSNSTEHAAALSKAAEEAGADALLVVSPYYNKATAEGLYLHYNAIAASVHIPLIVYNVPSRTGLDIPVAAYRQLAQIPNIIGVKEASGDLGKIAQIRQECPEDFYIWSGCDELAVPVLALGGQGLISVVSNLFPERTQAMTAAALAGDMDSASALQIDLLPMIRLLFREINPAPIKSAMKLIGYDCGECRLPLTLASGTLRKQIAEALANS